MANEVPNYFIQIKVLVLVVNNQEDF